ncbi:MAG: tetratricopeptide repeat protein [Actinomycetota bacterium]
MQQPRDFSLHGAVDLGARQAAAQRQAARAAGAGGAPGATAGHVIDVTDETFNTEVVDRSRSVPVIMDLWAEWCEPCKQLGPVLEKLAAEADGAWVLAKVDIDANPQLRGALQVQSIPMVVAVAGGQMVDAFLGVQPEAQIRGWIGQIIAAAVQLGLPGPTAGPEDGPDGAAAAQAAGPGGRPYPGPGPMGGPGGNPMADPAFGEARDAMERGDLDGAAAAFEKVLATAPGHPVASLGLAQVELFRRVGSYDQAKARREAAENPDDVDAQIQVADIDVATGRIEEGFDRLLGVIRRTAGDDRNRARVHLVSLFEIFPPGDSRVTRARGRLSSLLF